MKDKTRTFTRKDIAQRVAEKRNIKLHIADDIVETVLSSMREILMTADPEVRIELRDFGVFEVKLTRAKPRARNPRTGDKVYVPPRRKTHFKPSKLLRSFLTKELNDDEAALLHNDGEREPNVYAVTPSIDDIVIH
jgi:integration host factor subunit beta